MIDYRIADLWRQARTRAQANIEDALHRHQLLVTQLATLAGDQTASDAARDRMRGCCQSNGNSSPLTRSSPKQRWFAVLKSPIAVTRRVKFLFRIALARLRGNLTRCIDVIFRSIGSIVAVQDPRKKPLKSLLRGKNRETHPDHRRAETAPPVPGRHRGNRRGCRRPGKGLKGNRRAKSEACVEVEQRKTGSTGAWR